MAAPPTPIMPIGPAASARRHRAVGLRDTAMAYALILPVFIVLLSMIVLPALAVVRDSVAAPGAVGRPPVSLRLYTSLLGNPITRHDIAFTMGITVVTVGLLLPLCYALALYLRFARGPLVGWCRFLCIVPLFVPTIISAFAFITFFQNQGVLDSLLRALGIERALHFTYNEPINDHAGVGIVLGELWNSIPVTVLLLGAGLGDIDDALIDAARDVGAGPWAIFLRIVVPLTMRPALVALTLSFLGVLGSFTIPYLLGPSAPQMLGPLLDTIFATYREPPRADALAVIMFLLSALVGVAYVVAVSRRSSAGATGRD